MLSLLASVALSATLFVDPNAPSGHTTIQGAIDAAAPYDRIVVRPGTYAESLVVRKPLALTAEGGVSLTGSANAIGPLALIDVEVEQDAFHLGGFGLQGNGTTCMTIDDTYVELDGVEFAGCGSGAVDGGAVEVRGYSHLLVRESRFVDNQALRGAGIWASSSTAVKLVQSQFEYNSAGTDGGAIYATGDVVMVETAFVANTAGSDGGALYFRGSSSAYALACLFELNQAGDQGGAIYSSSSEWTDLYTSRFCDNVAGSSGGAYHRTSSGDETWLYNNLFARNTAGSTGGAVDLSGLGAGSEVYQNTFFGNQAYGGASGGLRATGSLEVIANVFYDNTSGDAVLAAGSTHRYNLYSPFTTGSSSPLSGVTADTTEGFADPLFATSDASVGCAQLDPTPGRNSPLLDAGDPELWSSSPDDIGLTGGPGAPGRDGDGDGTPSFHDCDDGDPDVGWSAPELCNGIDDDCDEWTDGMPSLLLTPVSYFDDDDDGAGDPAASVWWCPTGPLVANAGDCDDADPDNHPNNDEVCDGRDNDCDQQVDQGLPTSTWYADGDGDGVGDASSTLDTCEADPAGYADTAGDCDDNDPGITGGSTWYQDGDGDGYGSATSSITACTRPDGYVADDTDCDDADAARNPDTVWYTDSDGDGFGDPASSVARCLPPDQAVMTGGDCDDTDPVVNPGTTWFVDADGDGVGGSQSTITCSPEGPHALSSGDCDDADSTVAGPTPHWPDADGDGFGDASASPIDTCPSPDLVANGEDCDDTSADVSPTTRWYVDSDGDGYGDPSTEVASCGSPGAQYVRHGEDCDDTESGIHPGTVWYTDEDGDGLGGTVSVTACAPSGPHVRTSTDCDDSSAAVRDASPHWLDGDGDGFGDDATGPTDRCPAEGYVPVGGDCDDADDTLSPDTTWYPDADGDTYGDEASPAQQCVAPAADSVRTGGDCDDADAGVNPDTEWYADLDTDGYGDPLAGVVACEAPDQHVRDATDCDDTLATTHPTAPELCDGVDNDCDPTTPDDVAPYTWYEDTDADGYGTGTVLTISCMPPDQGALLTGDCDDGEPLVHPGRPEICDTVDNDCDGTVDVGAIDAEASWVDADRDGYGGALELTCVRPPGNVLVEGDCDDTDADSYPGADERCDGVDNDCDLDVDEEAVDRQPTWPDLDGDGYGDASGASELECEPSDGRSALDSDCDDAASTVHPGADEIPDNGVDEDCDGSDVRSPTPTDPLPTEPVPTGDELPDEDVAGPALWYCSATSGRGGVLGMLLAGLAVARRRRDQSWRKG